MVISKKVEFSASHICRSAQLTDAENERVYGAAANPLGHGHNYVVEVAIEGEPDPVTGMILDLKRLRDILEEQCAERVRPPAAESGGGTVWSSGADGGKYRHRHLESRGTVYWRESQAVLGKST